MIKVWCFRAEHVLWCLLVCLSLGIFWGTGSMQYLPVGAERAGSALYAWTIVLDPGHGGIDPGAVSRTGIREKDIVLAIAVELEGLLKEAGAGVVMVRRGDYDLADSSELNLLKRKRQDLSKRVFIAEQARADLYISIHANHFPSPIWHGAQTFYDQENLASQELARTIQTELVRLLGPNHRLARPGDFRVLRDASMPAALVEVGFLSNPQEAELLGNPAYQRKVAEALLVGLQRYAADSAGATFP